MTVDNDGLSQNKGAQVETQDQATLAAKFNTASKIVFKKFEENNVVFVEASPLDVHELWSDMVRNGNDAKALQSENNSLKIDLELSKVNNRSLYSIANAVETALRTQLDDGSINLPTARSIFTEVMSELSIDNQANPFSRYRVTISNPYGRDIVTTIEASDEDDAMDKVREGITLEDVKLSYTIYFEGETADVEDWSFDADTDQIVYDLDIEVEEVSE